jgi:predicted AlkP superfamily pyrophosphatase or phosphodiesterase
MDGPLTSTRAKVMRYAIMRLSTILSGISYFPGLDEVPLKELAQLDFSIKKKLFEPNCFSPIPSLFDILIANHLSYRYVDHDLFDTDETVCQKALSRDFVENVTVVRLVDLDTASHRYGLESQERNRIIRQTDSLVEKTISTWKGQHDDLFTVCFADHGMVVAEKFLDIEKILSQSGLRIFQDYDTFLDSTIARFWATNQILEKITMILSHRDEGRILSSFERKQYHIPSSDKYGQLIFLANPGYVISPNFFEKHSQVKAMHGYDPATPGLETFLSVEGPLIHQLGRKNRLSMVDVLPTMLETLNLPIPDYCTGHSIVGNSPR